MKIFRKIPLPGKLLLLVFFPMVLIVILTLRVYQDNNERVALIRSYLDHINLFADLSSTATHLQIENRRAYVYALKEDSASLLSAKQVREGTDSILKRLDSYDDINVKNFRRYTFLDSLPAWRRMVDDSTDLNPDVVSHFYTTSIFRVKTITQSASVNNPLVDTVFEDLTSARILNDIFMYLGVLRVNFYKSLFAKENNLMMLYGLRGSYDVLGSYEKELLEKANPDLLEKYMDWRYQPHVTGTLNYLDTVFARFSFDTSMNAEDWWEMSERSNDELRILQQGILDRARVKMEERYDKEIRKRDTGLFIMLLSLVAVLAYMFYTSRVLNSQLRFLDQAAQKISAGEEAETLSIKPRDVIGRLARSIEKIDTNNKELAYAATRIGKGDFDIEIKPRGEKDSLGIAIAAMKDDLEAYIAEIREHEKRKDDFIVMASHELKTPITSIKGYVQLLFALFNEYQRTRELPSEESVSSSLGVIDKQIKKLTRLLSELLDLSRLERGKLELQLNEFNLNEVVKETIDEVRQTASNREIIVEESGTARVMGDRNRIEQVMLNLLTNALKYSEAPDPVNVRIDATDKEVRVTVRDKGIGINEAEQQKIFERFYRVAGKSEQTYPGFGVGLYIAREIITRHGGQITVKSEKGRGSEFQFVLTRIQD